MTVPKMLSDAWGWLEGSLRFLLPHAVLTILLLAAAELFLAGYHYGYAEDLGRQAVNAVVTKELRLLCAETEKGMEGGAYLIKDVERMRLPGLQQVSEIESEKLRFAAQLLKAQRLQCMHADLAVKYIANYYAAALVTMVCGALAAVAFFFIGATGWATANKFVVNVFLTMGIYSAFYGSFPAVFNQSALATAHKARVLQLDAMMDGMASYTAARIVPAVCIPKETKGMPSESDDKLSATASVIRCIDMQLSTAEIPFSMDPSKAADYKAVLAPLGGQ